MRVSRVSTFGPPFVAVSFMVVSCVSLHAPCAVYDHPGMSCSDTRRSIAIRDPHTAYQTHRVYSGQ